MTTAVCAVLMLTTVGCEDDGGRGKTVTVLLSEFVVEPDLFTVDAGEVTFAAQNKGGETHELLVVKAASAGHLPVDDHGAFDEAGFGRVNVLGEVEDLEPGQEKSLTLDLEAGPCVLLCNIVEEEESGEVERHFAEGMHISFHAESS